MATNDFLPFAAAAGANVLAQAAYAALPAVSTGYGSGIAKSEQVNKTLRQSSIMSAVLAQFIADQTGANSVDDGTTATLLANFKAAAKATSSTLVAQTRNLFMSVAAASATATLTADEIVVSSALGGLKYVLANFSKTINLTATGAGGMDTGSPPTNGFVALYAIYNPTTGASALLGVNASTAVVPEVYGGANMPSGYAASALVSVVPTNGASQFPILTQSDRTISFTGATMFATASSAASPTIVNNLGVPYNAKFCSGFMQAGSSVAGGINMALYATSASVAGKIMAVTITAGSSLAVPFERLRITVAQRVYYTGSTAGGTSSYGATVNQYEF